MHRFFAAGCGTAGNTVSFSRDESAHAARVLRLSAGAVCEVTDPDTGRRFLAELVGVTSDEVTARLTEEIAANEPPVELTLYMGIPKADKLDMVVQKATELGAARVVPVRMERSVAKIDKKDAPRKTERLTRIAAEAVKQCGRARTPEICEPMDEKPAMQAFGAHELSLMLWEDADDTHLKDVYSKLPGARDIAVWIGPEGGISPAEAEALTALGAHNVTLGSRILRTETAAVAAMTAVMLLWGDL